MGDSNVENACQMIDRKSEHSYSSQHPGYHNPSVSLANCVYHQLGVIQFYHQPCYDLSAAALYCCHNAACHNAYILAASSNFAPLNNGSSNHFQLAYPVATGAITNPQFLQYTPTGICLCTNEQSEVTDCHRVAYKRNHSEVATGDYHLPVDPGSSSASSRQLLHEEPNENGFNVMTQTTFTSDVYLENVKAQTEGAQHGSERSSEILYNNYAGQAFQPSSFGSLEQHENCSHGGGCYNWNYTNPPSCMDGRFLESGAADTVDAHMQEDKEAWTYGNSAFVFPFSNQDQHQPSVQSMQVLSHMQEDEEAWTYGNSAFVFPFSNQDQHQPSVQSMQVLSHMQEDEEAWTYGNSAFVFPFSNQDQHQPSVQSMQVLSHSQNVQASAPSYWLPVGNLHSNNADPSVSDENLAHESQIMQVPSVSPLHWLPVSNVQTINAYPSPEVVDPASRSPSVQVYSTQNIQTLTPYQLPVTDLQTSNAHPSDSANRSPRPSRLIPEEVYWSHQHEAAEEYEVYHGEESDYESDSDSDLHGDMRLDIEDMAYEQLLALEEHMGDVNTGFSEDSILKNLKTSVCAPLALTLSPPSVSLLNERCTICLVEYEEDERIGTLDCGHRYHADCIKEWLLIKNLCPICRTFALASGGDDLMD